MCKKEKMNSELLSLGIPKETLEAISAHNSYIEELNKNTKQIEASGILVRIVFEIDDLDKLVTITEIEITKISDIYEVEEFNEVIKLHNIYSVFECDEFNKYVVIHNDAVHAYLKLHNII